MTGTGTAPSSAAMTPDQIALARHALGLPNAMGRSYRNRYFAPANSTAEAAWLALCADGLAEKIQARGKMASVGFCLTRAGAEAALLPREKLCPEDFPPEAPASAIAEATS